MASNMASNRFFGALAGATVILALPIFFSPFADLAHPEGEQAEWDLGNGRYGVDREGSFIASLGAVSAAEPQLPAVTVDLDQVRRLVEKARSKAKKHRESRRGRDGKPGKRGRNGSTDGGKGGKGGSAKGGDASGGDGGDGGNASANGRDVARGGAGGAGGVATGGRGGAGGVGGAGGAGVDGGTNNKAIRQKKNNTN